jgi:DNA-binding transcriptional LysR family regulator
MTKRHLPPLNALRIFETAAHASSLSAAAEELGLTHGAVSRQIGLLEDWLGQPLFMRQGQRSVATEHARAFAAEISGAFDRIGDAAVRFGRTPATRVVRINCQTTFATRWLMPRLPTFHDAHPGIELVLATANSDEGRAPFGFDIAIRRDGAEQPEWRHFDRYPLFEEKLTLLAAPALLARQPLASLADLAKQVFVSSQTRTGEWERWLQAAGIDGLRPRRYQRFDHYHVGLQALVDGLGVGIGGLPTLAHEVEQGRLVAPFPILAPGSGYAAWVAPDADKTQALDSVLRWLQQEAAGAQ